MMTKPTINNDIYNENPSGWWEDDSFLNILETGIQPVRGEYIRTCLKKVGLTNPDSLDIGCGGGIIAEDLSIFSKTTTGVDISIASLEIARQHAHENGLTIDYQESTAENLPFEDNSFDLITCCDVLEHVSDLTKVISEINRVLRPGGLFVYDTVNRTIMSYLSLIFVTQDFPLTRFAPKNAHVWHKFIKPEELLNIFNTLQLQAKEQIGMAPAINPLKMIWYILQVKYKHLSYGEFGNKAKFKTSNNKSISYLGYCVKQ